MANKGNRGGDKKMEHLWRSRVTLGDICECLVCCLLFVVCCLLFVVYYLG